jgi:hypothetical protein
MQTNTVALVGFAVGAVAGYGIAVGAAMRTPWLVAFTFSVGLAVMAGALAIHWGRILDEEEAVKPPR